MIKVITISGNIAIGKSTLIKRLTSLFPNTYEACEESLDNDMLLLLKHYYEDPDTYAFKFQYNMLKLKFDELRRLITRYGQYKVILLERSFETDRKCFFEKFSSITDKEHAKYDKLYNTIELYMSDKDIVSVYLCGRDTNDLMKRISERNRVGEELITPDKLIDIEASHNNIEFDYIFMSNFAQSVHSISTRWFDYTGTITLYTGPMFSGKTTRLIKSTDEQSLVIKHQLDERGALCTNKLVSHDGVSVDAVSCSSDTLLSVCVDKRIHSSIGIDEGQFFDTNGLVFAEYCANIGLDVYISALSSDFTRQKFSSTFIDIADKVHHCTAKCACGKPAVYSKRTNDSMETVLIGGNDLYIPTCRRCFYATC